MKKILKQLNLKSMTSIEKGWSCDKKFCVTTNDNEKYLLRITPFDKASTRKDLFNVLQVVAKLDIPMCKAVKFGECAEGVYTMYSWIEGEDAEEVIPLLPETEQYVLGLKAGEILKKIHTIPCSDIQENWYTRFKRKTEFKVAKYLECPIQFEGSDKIIEYINTNYDLLKDRPQSFQHGDFGLGNLMYNDGGIYVIDFTLSFGDPWQDFESIRWMVDKSVHFATGMIDGYFDKIIPIKFWTLLKFYLCEGFFHNLVWSVNTENQEQIEMTLRQIYDVHSWYDNMQNIIPSWYIKDFYYQYIDGIPCKLKSAFDFSFLSKYGKIFKVFDDQDSGNICFGVEKDNAKYFIKFAGAPTERSTISAEEAMANLKYTTSIYKDLKHDSLIKYISDEEVGGGYAVIFEWVNAECMGRMYPLSRKKFMTMSLEKKMQVFEDILIFHKHVAEQNYVAIDFYDGSVMYDFENEKTIICDIDFYSKTPYINEMGRMWGSSKMMSPEEFQKGMAIDEITNVYNMGAFAFALFSDYDRSKDSWTLSKKLYNVVIKAISDDRGNRHQSIGQLLKDWSDFK